MAECVVQSAVEIIDLSTPEDAVDRTCEIGDDSEISVVAYRLWEERGRPDGDPDRDWYEAERKVRPRNGG